jgi:hypothetical protein
MARPAPEDFGFFASRPLGRALLNAFLLMTCVSLVAWNLPFPTVRERLRPVVAPLVFPASPCEASTAW